MTRLDETAAVEPIEQDPGHQPAEVKERAMPAWMISAVAHVTVLFVFSLVVMMTQPAEEDPLPVRVTTIEPPTIKDPDKVKTRDLAKPALDYVVPVETEKPSPVSVTEVTPTDFDREENIESPIPKGREEAKGDSEMGGRAFFSAIGSGSGAMGMLGSRTGDGKRRALGTFGGTPGSENAVEAALRWFKKHQNPNGQWDVDGYVVNCTENPKCEAGTENTDEAGDIACTGYALLCYLGAGYDHRMGSRYRLTVKKAIDWLLSVQKPDGLWGVRNYEHAIATMAMAEAYAMSGDGALKSPSQRGVDIVLKRQTPDSAGGYGLGWDYVDANLNRMDSSVSGWNVMALKSAAAANLNIGNGLEGSARWLRRTWEATNPEWKKLSPYGESRFPYTWSVDGTVDIGEVGSNHKDLACVGLICSVFLSGKLDNGKLITDTLANYNINHHLPKGYPVNSYYLYYNTLGIFQAGGDHWTKWNDATRDLLVNAQRRSDDCFDGSWDFQGTLFHGHKTGRLLSTAYNCLSLEVYYRYLPIGHRK